MSLFRVFDFALPGGFLGWGRRGDFVQEKGVPYETDDFRPEGDAGVVGGGD